MKEETKTLYDMTVAELRSFIEEDYYRACVEHRPKGAEFNSKLSEIITSVHKVELKCAKIERYDLASLCRDTNIELAEQRDLNTTCNCCGEINCIQA